jgi:SAM-dependent methyltransferase
MPTVERNLQQWDARYQWARQGDEWSSSWGGTEAQWLGAILPRIHAFLPATTILEIAPGFGRWTQYLKDQCDHLIVVDLAASCIQACRERFVSSSHITYHVNDGVSLAMVPNGTIDFVFSFDSLVHAEADVLEAYLRQLATKLAPDGVGFLHHSNIGAYPHAAFLLGRVPGPLGKWALRVGLSDRSHGRAFSMTARRFEELCRGTGLQCIGQELVDWGARRLIDCFSTFTRERSSRARPNRVIANSRFMEEAAAIKRRSAANAAR